jgi:hypothetical protein
MSSTRLAYRELDLKLVSLEDECSHQTKRTPMVEEKRDEEEGDSIKLFLMEVLMQ